MTLLIEGEQALVPVEAVDVGDQLLCGGDWMTVARVQLDPVGGRYLAMTGGRVFHALAGAQRIARTNEETTS